MTRARRSLVGAWLIGAVGCVSFPKDRADPELLNRLEPLYPPLAIEAEVEGYVDLTYTVTADGAVTDVAVVESVPPGVFDEVSIASLKRWTYAPRVVDGVAIPADKKVRLTFKFDDGDASNAHNPRAIVRRVVPIYPPNAAANGVEGWVILSLTIEKDGTVSEVMVIDSKPRGAFDRAAALAVRQWRYTPRLVTTPDVRVKITFNLRSSLRQIPTLLQKVDRPRGGIVTNADSPPRN